MSCQGCKWYETKKGKIPKCARYLFDHPKKCLDFRHKQGQRVK